MAEGRRDNKRKIEAPEEEVKKVRELAEKTANDTSGIKRGLDVLDKSTLLVLENSKKVEELYQTATETRNFKNLAKDTAEAVLQELSQLTKLPAPLPGITPEEWQQISAATAAFNTVLVKQWWIFSEALQQAVKFVTPNKARSTRDEGTRTWTRKPGHFVLQLQFGTNSLKVQECLQGYVGSALAQVQKDNREQGQEGVTNLFVNRTQSKMDRRKGKGKGKNGKGKGKGKGRGRQGGLN
eukprot:s94_g27.t1